MTRLAAEGIQKCNIVVLRENVGGAGFWRQEGWVERPDLAFFQKFI